MRWKFPEMTRIMNLRSTCYSNEQPWAALAFVERKQCWWCLSILSYLSATSSRSCSFLTYYKGCVTRYYGRGMRKNWRTLLDQWVRGSRHAAQKHFGRGQWGHAPVAAACSSIAGTARNQNRHRPGQLPGEKSPQMLPALLHIPGKRTCKSCFLHNSPI